MKYNVELDISVGTSHSLILNRIKPKSKVLEFGSATGYMTKYMKQELDCEIVCIEIDAEAAEKTREYADIMIVADIEKMTWFQDIKDLKFDYILFADVLEHLRNPQSILDKAVSLLNQEGIVMTSVPNISHNAIIMGLMQGDFDYRPTGLLDDTHVHFFTRKSLLELLEKSDLEPLEWLTTMRRPETTEFMQTYDNFPVAVQNYLKNRLDGDVYQFITISTKRRSSNDLYDYTYNQHCNYLDLDHCQVFWGVGGLFEELSSLQLPVSFNNDFRTYSFNIPKGSKGNLRFDPSNTPVYGEIKRLDLFLINQDGVKEKVDIDNNEYLNCLEPNSDTYKIKNESSYRFFATNNDPAFLIKGIELREEQQYVLEIEMLLNNAIEEIIKQLSTQFNGNYMELLKISDENRSYLSEIDKMNNNYILLSQQHINLNGKYDDLLKEHIKLKDELSNMRMEHNALITEQEKISGIYAAEIKEKERIIDQQKGEILLMQGSISWRSTSVFRNIVNKIKR